MAERESCQSLTQAVGVVPTTLVTCASEVRNWRACGLGCGKVFAFCEAHGGDGRALRACVSHHETCPKAPR